MKYLFALILIVNFYHTEAQKYQPLVEEGKYWIYNHHDYSVCFLMGQRLIEIRYFKGDTTIMNHQYKNLISAYGKPKNSNIEIYEKKTVCFMREDTTQQKVFMINNDYDLFPCIDSLEICIWDFSLQVGDTTTHCVSNMFLGDGIEGLTHCIVDSVETCPNGKILYTKGVMPGTCGDLAVSRVFYVEGHGMDVGPMYRKFNMLFTAYCEGTLEQCNIVSSTKDITESNIIKWTMYPNPVWEVLNIETEIGIEKTEIIDQNGRIVFSGSNIEINVSHLLSGVYFVKCYSVDNKLYYSKFVKM